MISRTERAPPPEQESRMEFVLIMLADREAPEDPSIYPEMGRFAGELAGSGKLRGGAPLHSEDQGARVTGTRVDDGPFPSRVVIGGYFVVDCKSRAEAIEIARRCPHARVGTVEVRQIVAMGPPPSRKPPRKKAPARAKKSRKKSPARRKKR
jgi:hypothetical protein